MYYVLLSRSLSQVRCADGKLLGATRSDHGHIVIQLFPLAGDGQPIQPGALAEVSTTPTPGRVTVESSTGVKFQDESEYAPMCPSDI